MKVVVGKENQQENGWKARLPWIDKISTEVLESRVKLGVRRTLNAIAAIAGAPVVPPDAQRQAISACNFSASQCIKELKKRGVSVR